MFGRSFCQIQGSVLIIFPKRCWRSLEDRGFEGFPLSAWLHHVIGILHSPSWMEADQANHISVIVPACVHASSSSSQSNRALPCSSHLRQNTSISLEILMMLYRGSDRHAWITETIKREPPQVVSDRRRDLNSTKWSPRYSSNPLFHCRGRSRGPGRAFVSSFILIRSSIHRSRMTYSACYCTLSSSC